MHSNKKIHSIVIDILGAELVARDISSLESEIRQLENSDFEAIYEFSRATRVAPLLFRNLTESTLIELFPSEHKALLQKCSYATLIHNTALRSEFQNLLKRLELAKVKIMPIKGIILDEVYYPAPGLRPMVDVDFLIHKENLSIVDSILRTQRFTQITSTMDADMIAQIVLTEREYVKKDSTGFLVLEPHFELNYLGYFADDNGKTNITRVWENAIDFSFDGNLVKLMSPEDSILNLCGHQGLKHASECGLISFLDIAHIILKSNNSINWDYVASIIVQCPFGAKIYNLLDEFDLVFPGILPQAFIRETGQLLDKQPLFFRLFKNDLLFLNLVAKINQEDGLTRKLKLALNYIFPSKQYQEDYLYKKFRHSSKLEVYLLYLYRPFLLATTLASRLVLYLKIFVSRKIRSAG